ncbi:DUF1287 domain-containing protein [Rubritalea tangerina]|uniref:DUF1287 domain-containing protein n=1 Tax=Rubritalea tangerina TaxID=430798 RepID=A0ABW4ZBZ2_9BACT
MLKKLHCVVILPGLFLLGVMGVVGQSQVGEGLERQSREVGVSMAQAARWQVGKTVSYDPEYVGLKYPMGDLPIEKGVCTDVVVRAMRKAYGIDLQRAVHEDMKKHFSKYPQRWGLKRPDRNIDHRRVPNLQKYFERQGWALEVTKKPGDYRPGDLVTCTVAGRLPHIMIVSDKKDSSGVPMVIHNIGSGAREEACLFDFPLTGHYRLKR